MQMRIAGPARGMNGRTRWWPGLVMGLAASATAAPAAPTPAPATAYRIVQLSPHWNYWGNGVDINARGQVAFTEIDPNDHYIRRRSRAKLYDGDAVRDLGTLGGPFATVAALNDAGQVVGASATSWAMNQYGHPAHAYRWSKETGMVDLASPGTGNSEANGINKRGWVTGWAEFAAQPQGHAFRWTPQTGMVDLGALDPESSSSGHALNDAGTVIGTATQGLFPFDLPVYWQGKDPVPMAPYGTPYSAALDINEAGQIVGNGAIPSSNQDAFLWTLQKGFVDLGLPMSDTNIAEKINEHGVVTGVIDIRHHARGFVWSPEHGLVIIGTEDSYTHPHDLNNLGQVVGESGGRAFVWTRAGGVVDLNTRIPGAPPGLELDEAIAISDNGSIVASGNTGLVLLLPGLAYRMPPVAAPIQMTGSPRANALLSFFAEFRDVDVRDTHKAVWSWGDGSETVGTISGSRSIGSVSGQHAYARDGNYEILLTVTDSSGKSTTVADKVTVSAAAAAVTNQRLIQRNKCKQELQAPGTAPCAALVPGSAALPKL